MIYLRKDVTIDESIRYRRSEWGLALITVLWGAILLEPYQTSTNPNWVAMREWAPEWAWGTGAVLIGIVRIVILIINGLWRRSSHARAAAAAICCFLWASLLYGLILAATWSPQMAIYLGFLIMDLHTIYEAMADARASDEGFNGTHTA